MENFIPFNIPFSKIILCGLCVAKELPWRSMEVVDGNKIGVRFSHSCHHSASGHWSGSEWIWLVKLCAMVVQACVQRKQQSQQQSQQQTTTNSKREHEGLESDALESFSDRELGFGRIALASKHWLQRQPGRTQALAEAGQDPLQSTCLSNHRRYF